MTPKRQLIVVTGCKGQVVQSLLERARVTGRFDIVALGRPDLDLALPQKINEALRAARPDVIVSAAAYTAVDQAETEEAAAFAVNATGAGKIAESAAELGIPLVHLSTDYVFDGAKPHPYVETDPVAPIGAYGRSKLAGEKAVSESMANYAILRTAWVYSPFGKNFLKTMLRLAETRATLNVVDDQIGNPTSALDLADGVLAVAANLLDSSAATLRGTFHMAGSGETSWADFAAAIFAEATVNGLPRAEVNRVPTSQYPTPARRPMNSRLDSSLLAANHEIRLPYWGISTARVVERLSGSQDWRRGE